eukprot:10683303-Prorocentrum_lima.AAC.1
MVILDKAFRNIVSTCENTLRMEAFLKLAPLALHFACRHLSTTPNTSASLQWAKQAGEGFPFAMPTISGASSHAGSSCRHTKNRNCLLYTSDDADDM